MYDRVEKTDEPCKRLINKQLLLVEDAEGLAHLMRRLLSRVGFEIVTLPTGQEALDYLRQNQPGLLLLDYYLPDMTGHDVILRLREEDHLLPFIVMTGSAEECIADEMVSQGAVDCLIKNGSFIERLTPAVMRAWERIQNPPAGQKGEK